MYTLLIYLVSCLSSQGECQHHENGNRSVLFMNMFLGYEPP